MVLFAQVEFFAPYPFFPDIQCDAYHIGRIKVTKIIKTIV